MKRVIHKRVFKKQSRAKWVILIFGAAAILATSLLLKFYISDKIAEIPFVRSNVLSKRLSEFISNFETSYFLKIDGQSNWNATYLQTGRVVSDFSDRLNRLDMAAKQVKANLIFETSNNKSVQYVSQTLKYPRYARYRIETVPLLPGESFDVEIPEDEQGVDELFVISSLCTADRIDGRPQAVVTFDESQNLEHEVIPNGPLTNIKFPHSNVKRFRVTWPTTAPGVLFVLGTRARQTAQTNNKVFVTIDEVHGNLAMALPRTLKAVEHIRRPMQATVWPEYENSLQNLQFLFNGVGNSIIQPKPAGENLFKLHAQSGYRTLAINLESAHPCHRMVCSLEHIFLRNRYTPYIPENLTIPFEKNIKTAYHIFEKKLHKPEGLLVNLNITTRPNALHLTWAAALSAQGSFFSWLTSSFFDSFDIESSKLLDSTREAETNIQLDEVLSQTISQFTDSQSEVTIYIKKLVDEQSQLDYGQGKTFPGVLVTTREHELGSEPISLADLVSSQAILGPGALVRPKKDEVKYIQMERGDLWLFGKRDEKRLAYMNSLTFLESHEAHNQGPIVSPLDKKFKPLLGELKGWIESRRIYSFIIKSNRRATDGEELRIKSQNKFLMCHANHNEKFMFYDGITLTIKWPAQMENDFYIVCQLEENPEHADIEIYTSKSQAFHLRFGQYSVLLPYDDDLDAISIKKQAFQNWLYADSIPYLAGEREILSGQKPHTLIWTNHRVDWNIDDYLFLQTDSLTVP